MTGNVAGMIRMWVSQNGVVMICGRGKGNGNSIRSLVQSEKSETNFTENIDGSAVEATPQRFSNDFIPKVAKFVLQFRSGIAHVELGK